MRLSAGSKVALFDPITVFSQILRFLLRRRFDCSTRNWISGGVLVGIEVEAVPTQVVVVVEGEREGKTRWAQNWYKPNNSESEALSESSPSRRATMLALSTGARRIEPDSAERSKHIEYTFAHRIQ